MPGRPGIPGHHRIAAALTFDFDADSAWRKDSIEQTPSAASRWLYGVNEGLPRILRLLEQYKLPATFFVPGATADFYPDSVKRIVAAGHEIGHHGYFHEAPPRIDAIEERAVIEKGLDALQRIAGVTPKGYRSPAWELSEATFGLLKEYGFEYDASQLAADRPYWIIDRGENTGLVELPSAWELCDSSHFLFAFSPVHRTGLASPSRVEEIWVGDFDYMYAEGGDITYILTVHPEIIGRPHRMALLERTIQHILAHDDVWFAQMHELSTLFRQRQAQQ